MNESMGKITGGNVTEIDENIIEMIKETYVGQCQVCENPLSILFADFVFLGPMCSHLRVHLVHLVPSVWLMLLLLGIECLALAWC